MRSAGGCGDSREDVVDRVVRGLGNGGDAAVGVGVVRVHERVDEGEVRAERAADLDGVVGREPATARELGEEAF